MQVVAPQETILGVGVGVFKGFEVGVGVLMDVGVAFMTVGVGVGVEPGGGVGVDVAVADFVGVTDAPPLEHEAPVFLI